MFTFVAVTIVVATQLRAASCSRLELRTLHGSEVRVEEPLRGLDVVHGQEDAGDDEDEDDDGGAPQESLAVSQARAFRLENLLRTGVATGAKSTLNTHRMQHRANTRDRRLDAPIDR